MLQNLATDFVSVHPPLNQNQRILSLVLITIRFNGLPLLKRVQSILKICKFLRLVLRGILGEEMRSASALVVPPFHRERNGPLRRRQTSAKELSGIWIFNFSWSTLLLKSRVSKNV